MPPVYETVRKTLCGAAQNLETVHDVLQATMANKLVALYYGAELKTIINRVALLGQKVAQDGLDLKDETPC